MDRISHTLVSNLHSAAVPRPFAVCGGLRRNLAGFALSGFHVLNTKSAHNRAAKGDTVLLLTLANNGVRVVVSVMALALSVFGVNELSTENMESRTKEK